MSLDVLMTVFVAVNAVTSTGTLLAVFHLWRKMSSRGSQETDDLEEEVLERNLNTRLRDLQTARFSLKFSNLPDGTTGKKRQ